MSTPNLTTTKRIIAFATFALILISLTGCDTDDDYYYSPLIGDWVLVADDYGPVEMNQSIFTFYGDGSGVFTDYDEWGYEYNYDIFWEPDGELLYVSFSNAETWTYRWAIAGSYLYLTDLDTGSRLTYQIF